MNRISEIADELYTLHNNVFNGDIRIDSLQERVEHIAFELLAIEKEVCLKEENSNLNVATEKIVSICSKGEFYDTPLKKIGLEIIMASCELRLANTKLDSHKINHVFKDS